MSLSPREKEILRHVAGGRTTKETAAALGVAESTVEWHVSNILAKLAVASRTEAVAVALRDGLMENATAGQTTSSGLRRGERERVVAFDLLGLPLGVLRLSGWRRRADRGKGTRRGAPGQ